FGIRYSDSSCDIPPPDDAHPMRPARALSKRVHVRLRFGERLCNLPPEGLPGFRCLLVGKGGVREDELRFSARAFFDGRGELTPGLEVTSPVAALGRFAASGLLWGLTSERLLCLEPRDSGGEELRSGFRDGL